MTWDLLTNSHASDEPGQGIRKALSFPVTGFLEKCSEHPLLRPGIEPSVRGRAPPSLDCPPQMQTLLWDLLSGSPRTSPGTCVHTSAEAEPVWLSPAALPSCRGRALGQPDWDQ